MKNAILFIAAGIVSWLLVALVSAQPPLPTPVRVVIPNTKWEASVVSLPTLKQVPFLTLTSTPPRLKFQGKPGKYRVIGSNDGIVCYEIAWIDVFQMYGRTEWEVSLPVPTNKFYWLVAPK